jgi:PIN domain nuclease of toxin-antitoxin system
MRLLLDTQVALWALTDDLRLSPQARGRILDAHNEVFVSVATLWEIAIKYQLRRGDMPVSARRAAELTVPRRGIRGAIDPP